MKYEIKNDGIIAYKDDFFNPYDTVKCGQTFRYEIKDDKITIYSTKYRCIIEEFDTYYYIYTNVPNYFAKYLDFDQNYDIIYTKLVDKGLIKQCADFSKGIRILNQNPVEMIISFIISANNNIPRIQKIINSICRELGENMGDYYAFPEVKALASVDEQFYKSVGAGYRASYLVDTANKLLNCDIASLQMLPTAELLTSLQQFKGVGPKVADCIALFGFHRGEVCPIDTWMKKVYLEYFGKETNPKIIRENLTNMFGELSGYMQQYLFYYKRELDK